MFINRYPFKLAIISALGYVIGDFLSVSYSYYIVYGILVSVSPTIGQSIQESIKRVAGIASGGFIATILIVNWELNSISVALGVFLMILFCYAINAPQLIAQGGVTFSLVAIGHLSGLDQYYWERFIDNTMGVIVGTMTNFLLPPPLSAVKLERGVKQLLIQIGDLYRTIAEGYLNQNLTSKTKTIAGLQTQIRKTLTNNAQLLQSVKIELSQGLGNSSQWQQIEERDHLIQELIVIVEEMGQVVENGEKDRVYKLLLSEISYLVQTTHQTFQALSNLSWSNLSRRENFSLPNLSEALANLDSRIEEIDTTGESYDYELDEVTRLSGFLDGLRAIANELIILSKTVLSV